jgi:hypothetical protein
VLGHSRHGTLRMLAAFVTALLSSVGKMRLAWNNVDNLSVRHVCTICSDSKVCQGFECDISEESERTPATPRSYVTQHSPAKRSQDTSRQLKVRYRPAPPNGTINFLLTSAL